MFGVIYRIISELLLSQVIMASSSSSKTDAESSNGNVFLSFYRDDYLSLILGETLSHYLRIAGIRVVRGDQLELRHGRIISLELRKAMKESNVSIALLSNGYASSQWCLKELVSMMECRRRTNLLVLPIFYCLTPIQFQNQMEHYVTNLCNTTNCVSTTILEGWRDVVTEVGGLTRGWNFTCSER